MRFIGFCAARYPEGPVAKHASPMPHPPEHSPPEQLVRRHRRTHAPSSSRVATRPTSRPCSVRESVATPPPLPVTTRPWLSWASHPETMCTSVPMTHDQCVPKDTLTIRHSRLPSRLQGPRARPTLSVLTKQMRVPHLFDCSANEADVPEPSVDSNVTSYRSPEPSRSSERASRELRCSCTSRSGYAGQQRLCRDTLSLRSVVFRRHRGNRSPQSGPGRPRHRVSPIRGLCG
jgi:hypothetical protein